jgi:hypothetical protein
LARKSVGLTELRRKLINNGRFHISRIAAFLWRGSDLFNQSTDIIQAQITTLQNTPADVSLYFDDGLNRLESLITANPEFLNDVDGALKSSLLENAITRSLHTKLVSVPMPNHFITQDVQLTLL